MNVIYGNRKMINEKYAHCYGSSRVIYRHPEYVVHHQKTYVYRRTTTITYHHIVVMFKNEDKAFTVVSEPIFKKTPEYYVEKHIQDAKKEAWKRIKEITSKH